METTAIFLRLNMRTVQAAMLLHNYCIERSDTTIIGLVNDEEFDEILSFTKSLMASSNSGNSSRLPGRHTNSSRSLQRERLVEVIEKLGYKRPAANTSQIFDRNGKL